MKFILLIVLVNLFVFSDVHAQLRKCTTPDGRVTYSDIPCSGSAANGVIKNPDGNSLDTSGFRQQVQKHLAEQQEQSSRAEAAARRGPPQECKFSYFSVGDEKVKKKAANAKAECIRNNEARSRGEPISMEHYTLWNDHRTVTSINRQGALTRANSDVNAWRTQDAIKSAADDIKRKSYTCTPNGFGNAFDCR